MSHEKKHLLEKIPLDLIVIITYVVIGVLTSVWHPTWLIFLAIPLWHSLLDAIKRRRIGYFAFPVFVLVVFLLLGFIGGFWHPGWLVFLSIPLFYAFVDNFASDKKGNQKDE